MKTILVVFAVLFLASANQALAATPQYTVTDLGTLPGGSGSYAEAINNNGQVVGYSYIGGDSVCHPFLWQSGSGMLDLGTLGGSYSIAEGINNLGQVVGMSDHVAFLYSGETMQNIGALLGGESNAQ